MARSPKVTLPELGLVLPVTISMKVVLPAPLGPADDGAQFRRADGKGQVVDGAKAIEAERDAGHLKQGGHLVASFS